MLGAGLVSRPLVEFLSRDASRSVVVASSCAAELDRVRAAFGGRGNVVARELRVGGVGGGGVGGGESGCLREVCEGAGVVASLLPAGLHGRVADAVLACAAPPHLVTASYVGDMAERHEAAAARGVRIVCEAGLDPGMDHMSAMSLVEGAKREDRRITSFRSICGGLPAPDVAQRVPGLRYKFSWSVRGALAAASNDAAWVEDGSLRTVAGRDLLASAEAVRRARARRLPSTAE